MTARPTISRTSRQPLLSRLRFAARSVVLRLDRAIERRNQRLTLAELTDDELDDIGLTRRDVERECRPFWRR